MFILNANLCVKCELRALLNFPAFLLCLIIGWAYYCVTFIIEFNLPDFPTFTTATFFVLFHVIVVLFVWSFVKSVFARSKEIPKEYHLSAAETVKYIDLDNEDERSVYLEQLVVLKHLPVNMLNRRGCIPFCDICFLIKPDRTHHCSSCEKCIPRMDHHCPWINNCIGFHNQKFFLLFLFYGIHYCSFCFFLTIPLFRRMFQAHHTMTSSDFHLFFLFIIALVFGIALAALFGCQLFLLLRNRSNIEYYQAVRFRHSCSQKSFHLGWMRNFMEVFGTRPTLWFLPVFTSLGDGITYPIRLIGSRENDELLLA